MSTKSFAQKFTAMFLIIALTISMIGSALAVNSNEEDPRRTAFEALPDDAIVCHIYGVPVYKYEIDESGRILKEIPDPLSTRSSGGFEFGNIAGTKHADEIITAGIQSSYTGYSEASTLLYLHTDAAEVYADGLVMDADSEKILAGMLKAHSASFPAVTRPLVAVIRYTLMLDSKARKGIAQNIYDYGEVRFEMVTSKYGDFYRVLEWDGETVYKPCLVTVTGGTINVSSVNCESHGAVW